MGCYLKFPLNFVPFWDSVFRFVFAWVCFMRRKTISVFITWNKIGYPHSRHGFVHFVFLNRACTVISPAG